jgi:hypothetical protein
MDYETVIEITSKPEKTVSDIKKEIEESTEPCGCGNCTCGND